MLAVLGFGRPVVLEEYNMNENFPSGSSLKRLTPGPAAMPLNLENRQDGNNDKGFLF